MRLEAGSRCHRALSLLRCQARVSILRKALFVLSCTSGTFIPHLKSFGKYILSFPGERKGEKKGAGNEMQQEPSMAMHAHDRRSTIDFSNINRAKTRYRLRVDDSATLIMTTKSRENLSFSP